MEEKQTLICDRCKVELVMADTEFSYLGNVMRHKVPRCPECGMIYLPENLVLGRMRELEEVLEEK
ncbi:MAG: DVU_1557 family redox protein [Anaerovoracaceae bacterium]|jgi:uncharacterized protein with PIN domain